MGLGDVASLLAVEGRKQVSRATMSANPQIYQSTNLTIYQ
jgi:hypothetical protein